MTDKYLAVCSYEMKEELIEWLDSNINIDEFEILKKTIDTLY